MSSRKDADFDGLYEKVPEWVYGIIERRNELYDALLGGLRKRKAEDAAEAGRLKYSKYQREDDLAIREKKQEYDRKYYAANREKRREYYAANLEKIR